MAEACGAGIAMTAASNAPMRRRPRSGPSATSHTPRSVGSTIVTVTSYRTVSGEASDLKSEDMPGDPTNHPGGSAVEAPPVEPSAKRARGGSTTGSHRIAKPADWASKRNRAKEAPRAVTYCAP